MNELTQALTSQYNPVLGIVVYKDKENDYYLESHDITSTGGFGPGKPLLQETMQGIVDTFFDDRQNMSTIKGVMPDNLLSYQFKPGGNYKIVWWRPSEIRVIHHASQLKLPTAKCWVPSMVYVADHNDLRVFALKNDKRPEENTILCLAPFFNVDDDGDVCLGNAKVQKPKEKTFSNLIKYWEALFWQSEFSHVNGEDKVKSKDLNAVWKKLLTSKTKLKWSTMNELIPSKTSMKNIL